MIKQLLTFDISVSPTQPHDYSPKRAASTQHKARGTQVSQRIKSSSCRWPASICVCLTLWVSAEVYCLGKPGPSKLRCKKSAWESQLNSMSSAVRGSLFVSGTANRHTRHYRKATADLTRPVGGPICLFSVSFVGGTEGFVKSGKRHETARVNLFENRARTRSGEYERMHTNQFVHEAVGD